MRLHDPFNKFWTLQKKELHSLAAAPSLWIMLLVEAPLVGYGFIQAVYLYTQASRSAVKFAELAKGMEPMQGIIVPSFGSLYLSLTLLFPFIAIRLMRSERDNGSIKVLLQTPASAMAIILAKLAAVSTAWLASLLPLAVAMMLWISQGGHLYLPALILLITGYALYALVITSIAFCASINTESPTSAAILTLAITLGVWVLDFASGTSGLLHSVSFVSLTESLRQFEIGMLSLPDTIKLSSTAVCLLAISTICLSPGAKASTKIGKSAFVTVAAIGVILLSSFFPTYIDFSEDRHNSFNPAFELALQSMKKTLQITINLSPDDSRLQEMEHNVLAKLRRAVPHLIIKYQDSEKQSLFSNPDDDKYGLIVYEYDGKKDEGRSNSPTEILPILFRLSGQKVYPAELASYLGYPLILEHTHAELIFYCFFPAAFLACWWCLRLPPKIKEL